MKKRQLVLPATHIFLTSRFTSCHARCVEGGCSRGRLQGKKRVKNDQCGHVWGLTVAATVFSGCLRKLPFSIAGGLQWNEICHMTGDCI